MTADALLLGFLDSSPVVEDEGALAKWLAAALERARETWPDVRCAERRFASWIGARVPPDPGVPLLERLGALHVGDLFLACACAAGDPSAIEAFEESFVPDALAAALRTGLARDRAEEVVADVRKKLLYADGERPARIEQFGGRGDLHGWVKVVASREAITRLRRETGSTLPPDDRLAANVSPGNPEVDLIRERFREEFRVAFRAALSGLTSRERNLLRHQVLDGLSIDEVGKLYRVHRATAARWLARARESVLEAVSNDLRTRLALGPAELESVLRLARSGVDLSLSQLFRTQGQ